MDAVAGAGDELERCAGQCFGVGARVGDGNEAIVLAQITHAGLDTAARQARGGKDGNGL